MKKIVYLFILLNSEKNEPRSAAAVIGLLGLSLRSPSGGLRNSLRSNSPRPFPSVSLASSPPDKGGIGDCCFCLYSNPLALWALPLYGFATQGESVIPCLLLSLFFLTPPSFGHLPYILLRKTQRRRVRCIFLSLLLRFYT